MKFSENGGGELHDGNKYLINAKQFGSSDQSQATYSERKSSLSPGMLIYQTP